MTRIDSSAEALSLNTTEGPAPSSDLANLAHDISHTHIPLRRAAILMNCAEKYFRDHAQEFGYMTRNRRTYVSRSAVTEALAARGQSIPEDRDARVSELPDSDKFITCRDAAQQLNCTVRGLPNSLYERAVMYRSTWYLVREEVEYLKQLRSGHDILRPGGLAAVLDIHVSTLNTYKKNGELPSTGDRSFRASFDIADVLNLTRRRYPDKLDTVVARASELGLLAAGSPEAEHWQNEVQLVKSVIGGRTHYSRAQVLQKCGLSPDRSLPPALARIERVTLGARSYYPRKLVDDTLESSQNEHVPAQLPAVCAVRRKYDLNALILARWPSIENFNAQYVLRAEAARILGWEPQSIKRRAADFGQIKLGRWYFVERSAVDRFAAAAAKKPAVSSVSPNRSPKTLDRGAYMTTDEASQELGYAKQSLPTAVLRRAVRKGKQLLVPRSDVQKYKELFDVPDPGRESGLRKLMGVSPSFVRRRRAAGDLRTAKVGGTFHRYDIQTVLTVCRRWRPERLSSVLKAALKHGLLDRQPDNAAAWAAEAKRVDSIITSDRFCKLRQAADILGVKYNNQTLRLVPPHVRRERIGSDWYMLRAELEEVARLRALTSLNPRTTEGLANLLGLTRTVVDDAIDRGQLKVEELRSKVRILNPRDVLRFIKARKPELLPEADGLIEEHMRVDELLDYRADKLVAAIPRTRDVPALMSAYEAVCVARGAALHTDLLAEKLAALDKQSFPNTPEGRRANSDRTMKKIFLQSLASHLSYMTE